MRHFMVARAFLPFVFALLVPATVIAQPEEPAAEGQAAEELSEEARLVQERQERLTTLGEILESIAVISEEILQLERDRDGAASDEEKASITEEIAGRSERVGKLEADFSVLATGIDREVFFGTSEEKFDWKEELEAVFAPVVFELKQATARPREIEGLRAQLASYEKRLPDIENALATLERLSEGVEEDAVNEQLTELTDFWRIQRDEFQSQRDASQQRLEELEREEVGFGEAAGDIMRLFFRQRGANLLFALLAFVAIFLVLRSLHRVLHRVFPTEGGSHTRQVFFRLLDVLYYVFTVVVAIGAVLVVLYLSADWVLLTLAVFVLIGLAWAARNAVPVFLEQGKLLLNMGSVREGERLIYQGIPWRVTVLSFFTDLENPSLTWWHDSSATPGLDRNAVQAGHRGRTLVSHRIGSLGGLGGRYLWRDRRADPGGRDCFDRAR